MYLIFYSMLDPKINLKLSPNGEVVSLYEETDVFTTLYNIGGWGNPNINTSNIQDAKVEVFSTTSTPTLLDTFILKDQISIDQYTLVSSIEPNKFKILETSWDNPDGIYKIVYTVEDSSTIYTNHNTYQLFTTSLCNCRESLIAKTLRICSSIEIEQNKKHLDQIEIFLYGVQTAFACGEFGRATNILEQANIYCQTVSDCCGCGC
jgi:hypothetical protein